MAGKDFGGAELSLVRKDMQILATEGLFGGHRNRAQLVTVKSLVGDVMRDDEMGLGIDGALHIVAGYAAVAGAGGHGAGIGIRQGNLAIWRNRPVSHISSTFRPESRSNLRLEGIRFR